jgi:hypothetical protein
MKHCRLPPRTSRDSETGESRVTFAGGRPLPRRYQDILETDPITREPPDADAFPATIDRRTPGRSLFDDLDRDPAADTG